MTPSPRSKRSAIRLGAIKALILDIPFEQVSAPFEADERTLRLWVVRSNLGLDTRYSTVWGLFHELEFSLKEPRPWPNRQDENKNRDHLRTNVCGIACPRPGKAFTLQFSHNDTDVYQDFLDAVNEAIKPERPRKILVMDNASWHHSKSLDFERIEPKYLPTYSPNLNPIERLWLIINAEWFNEYVCKTREALVDCVWQSSRWIMARTEGNIQTCRIPQRI